MGQTKDDPHPPAGDAAPRAALFIAETVARDHAIAAVLRRNGFAITAAANVRAAFEAGRERRFDLVVVGACVAATPALPDLITSIRETLRCPLICVGPHGPEEQIAEALAGEFAIDGDRFQPAPSVRRRR